jgi:short-subunit dehydrogenase
MSRNGTISSTSTPKCLRKPFISVSSVFGLHGLSVPNIDISRAVTGSNRGIGHTLAATIAGRPNTIVFAAARDPAAQSLKDLAAKHPNVHPIKLTSGDEADNAAAVAEIQKTAGQLDVVIANAGTPYFVWFD